MNPADADAIRARALAALARNRTPGYHFAGHFLELDCTRFEKPGVVFEMDAGPHNTDPDGTVNVAAVAFLADMALAASNRVFVDPTRRTATLNLQVQFTGEPARGRLRAEAQSDGFSERTVLAQAMSAGRVVTADGRETVRMSGTWVSPPSPDGRPLLPLPWEARARGASEVVAPALDARSLDPLEKAVMRRIDQAIRDASHGGFVHRFWAPVVKHTATGATGRLPLGMHVGNRVGHVQGGLLLNTALMTAIAAVPHHPVLTAVSAWYISPGQGKALRARSTVLQKGRNVAVVRTELFATGGKRVLEAVSNHGIAAH